MLRRNKCCIIRWFVESDNFIVDKLQNKDKDNLYDIAEEEVKNSQQD